MFVIGVGEPFDVVFFVYEKIEIPIVSGPSVEDGDQDVTKHVKGKACDCLGSPISLGMTTFSVALTVGCPPCGLVFGFPADDPFGH